MLMVLAQMACEGILGGSGTSGPFPQAFGILEGSWAELSFLALLFSLFLLAVIYMVANFTRNQQLLAWSKFELFQIFGTAAIFVFMLSSILGMCEFKVGFISPMFYEHDSGGNIIYGADGKPVSMNMYTVAEEYFARLQHVGQILFAYMMYVIKVINFLTRIQWMSNPMGLGMVDNPMEGIGQLNSVFFYMVSGFVTSYLLTHFQMRMMDYMAAASLYYLFPFGIFFRSFEPTRGFGGALLGISIAFFLFFPLTIAFNYYLIWDPFYNPTHGMQHGMETAIHDANQKLADPATFDLTQMRDDGLNQIGGTEDVNGVEHAKSEGLVGGLATGTIFILQPAMLYFMAAVALPILDFIVLVEITRAATKFLGDELDVSNLTRLI